MLKMRDEPNYELDVKRPDFADWTTNTNEITRTFLAANLIPDLINIAGGLPDPGVYPSGEIAEIAKKVVEEHPEQILGYGPVEGFPEFRETIAKRFSTDDLKLTKDNVIVVTSGTQGLSIIGKALLNDGDTMTGQFPTYLGAIDAWRPRNPDFRNMDLTDPDIDLADAFAGSKFVYSVPNFSNPTGVQVTTEMRQELVNEAHRSGTWLVEDDPYSSLLYEDKELPKLIDLSARKQHSGIYDGPVLYLGTMSKELAPGLRIGWIIAAPEMIEVLAKAKIGSDMCTAGITQWIALEAMRTGLAEKIRPAVLDLYRQRRDDMCAAMDEHISDWFEWEVPVGGMFIWAMSKDCELNTDTLLKYAMEQKVCIAPSSVFDAHGEHRRALRINFTHNSSEMLVEAIRRLAKALKAMDADNA